MTNILVEEALHVEHFVEVKMNLSPLYSKEEWLLISGKLLWDHTQPFKKKWLGVVHHWPSNLCFKRKHNTGLKFIYTLTKCSTCRASSTSKFVIIQSIIYTTKCITYKLLILVWLYNYHIFSPCCFLFCCCHIPPLPKLPATNLWAHPLLHRKKTLSGHRLLVTLLLVSHNLEREDIY